MKQVVLLVLSSVAFAGFATAQITQPSTDILGAHLNYGRGCAACHAPHSGSTGNGGKLSPASGNTILWGEDVSGLYGHTITTGGGKYVEVLPASMSANTPDAAGMLTCLGCHDGNFAPAAMMKNKVYETLPSTYGNRNSIPTLIAGTGTASYVSEHPMGLNAKVGCGGTQGWDCSISNGVISMHGSASVAPGSNMGHYDGTGSRSLHGILHGIVCTLAELQMCAESEDALQM